MKTIIPSPALIPPPPRRARRQWPFCTLAGLLVIHASLWASPLPKTDGPVKVEIGQTNGGYQLYVDHRPFYIVGAGGGADDQERMAACGANSFRTWSTGPDAKPMLDRAVTNGLYVTLGLEVGRERQGFSYDDPAAVARQLERIKREVLKYKDHPAVIIWAIGNELNLNSTNPKVWDAVNDISKMIHQVDTNHLTTTPLAGFNPEVVQQVKLRAPDLDLISFQTYAGLAQLPAQLSDSHWTGPYLVTEWGATGHWEVQKTDWGAPIEDNSTVKADFFQHRFEAAIATDRARCLGSYAFLWGQKQERTPTWYGMFLASGETTASVDVMQHLWTGAWPAVRCPRLEGAWLDGKTAPDSIHLQAGKTYTARVEATDPNQIPLTYSWEVLEESRDLKTGGDFENRPQSLAGLVQNPKATEPTLTAPAKAGAYRLFVYVYDGQGRAAHANIPFYVDDAAPPSADTNAPAASKP